MKTQTCFFSAVEGLSLLHSLCTISSPPAPPDKQINIIKPVAYLEYKLEVKVGFFQKNQTQVRGKMCRGYAFLLHES
jgi:hypothetical protein